MDVEAWLVAMAGSVGIIVAGVIGGPLGAAGGGSGVPVGSGEGVGAVGPGLTLAGRVVPAEQLAGARARDEARVTARLLAPVEALRPGVEVTLALVFDIQPEWHIYYDGHNDTGFAPSIKKAVLPAGFSLGAMRWPAPHRYVQPGGGIVDHIYERRAVLVLPMKVPSDATPGTTAAVTLELEWLQCKDACEFGEQSVSITLPIHVEDAGPVKDSAHAGLVREAVAALPKRLEKDDPIAVELNGRRLVIESKVPAKSLEFYPSKQGDAPVDVLKGCVAAGSRLVVELVDPKPEQGGVRPKSGADEGDQNTTSSGGLSSRAIGIVRFEPMRGDKPRYYEIDPGGERPAGSAR